LYTSNILLLFLFFSKGYVGFDVVTVAGYSGVAPINAIGETTETLFAPYADGILGLSYSISYLPDVVIDHILTPTNNVSNVFFLGFGMDGEGVISFGDADPLYYDNATTWKNVSLTDNGTAWYTATPESLFVDSHFITSNSTAFGITLFDSGTTLLYLSSPVFAQTKSVVMSAYSTNDCLKDEGFWEQTGYCTITPAGVSYILLTLNDDHTYSFI
jgi:hypothetical protein